MPVHWPHQWAGLWRFLSSFEHIFFIFLGGSTIALRRMWQRVRENRAAGWPSADGVIQAAHVKHNRGFDVEVHYRYYAMQEYRYGKYLHHFRKKAAAEEFAAAIRGRTLQIRFREDNPNISVLMERDLQMAGVLQLR